jgi:hypothetical protein
MYNLHVLAAMSVELETQQFVTSEKLMYVAGCMVVGKVFVRDVVVHVFV